jgi:hypothetical protein
MPSQSERSNPLETQNHNHPLTSTTQRKDETPTITPWKKALDCHPPWDVSFYLELLLLTLEHLGHNSSQMQMDKSRFGAANASFISGFLHLLLDV